VSGSSEVKVESIKGPAILNTLACRYLSVGPGLAYLFSTLHGAPPSELVTCLSTASFVPLPLFSAQIARTHQHGASLALAVSGKPMS
jgi:hypothetical protein